MKKRFANSKFGGTFIYLRGLIPFSFPFSVVFFFSPPDYGLKRSSPRHPAPSFFPDPTLSVIPFSPLCGPYVARRCGPPRSSLLPIPSFPRSLPLFARRTCSFDKPPERQSLLVLSPHFFSDRVLSCSLRFPAPPSPNPRARRDSSLQSDWCVSRVPTISANYSPAFFRSSPLLLIEAPALSR